VRNSIRDAQFRRNDSQKGVARARARAHGMIARGTMHSTGSRLARSDGEVGGQVMKYAGTWQIFTFS
jgi:hypothetical protein